jgi:hypothetical protein
VRSSLNRVRILQPITLSCECLAVLMPSLKSEESFDFVAASHLRDRHCAQDDTEVFKSRTLAVGEPH